MTPAQLKAFHAVASCGSIQAAAERLSLTQPAVSIQLKALEKDSPQPLLRKVGNQLALTSQGAELFAICERIFRAEEEARSLLTAEPGRQGCLVVGADGPHVALGLIEIFRRRHPGVKVETLLANAQQSWFNLLELRVDVAVLAGSPEHPRVHKCLAAKQGLMALLPVNHPLTGQASLTLEQLKDQRWIFREAGSSTQRRLNDELARHQLPIVADLVLGSREALYEAVARGMGIGAVYQLEVGQDPRVCSVPIQGLEEINWDQVAYLNNVVQNPLVAAFVECVDEYRRAMS